MNDISTTVAAKSDQLTADDLISGPITVTVTKVSVASGAEQPVTINYENERGKPFRPCKSMRRVLVAAWGKDGNSYVGKSMTLYRDPAVTFGGLAMGGVRISHMSHLDSDLTVVLTQTKANKKPFKVRPLQMDAGAGEAPKRTIGVALQALERDLAGCRSAANVDAVLAQEHVKKLEASIAGKEASKKLFDDMVTKAKFRDFSASNEDAGEIAA